MHSASLKNGQDFSCPVPLPGSQYLVNPNDFPGAGLAGDFRTFNMVREDAKQATKASVTHLVGFYLDFDLVDFITGSDKTNSGDEYRRLTKQKLLNGKITDSTHWLELLHKTIASTLTEVGLFEKVRAVVASGYGYHAHFWFDVPVNVSGDDGDKIKDKYESCLKKLIKTINDTAELDIADLSVTTVNRYCRMPGSFNHKGVMDGHTGEQKLVTLVSENPEARISVDEFFTKYKPVMGRPAGLKSETSIERLHQGKEWKVLPAWFAGRYALSSLKWVELLEDADLYINQKDEKIHYVQCLNEAKHGVAKDKDCSVTEKDTGWWNFHCFHKQCQRPEVLSVAAYLEHCGEARVSKYCERLNEKASKIASEVEEEDISQEPEEKYQHKFEYDDARLAELIVEEICEGNLGYDATAQRFYRYNGMYWDTRDQAEATTVLVTTAFTELRKYRYVKKNKDGDAKWHSYKISANKVKGLIEMVALYCVERQNGNFGESRKPGLAFRNGFLCAHTPEDGLFEHERALCVLKGQYMDFDYERITDVDGQDTDDVGAKLSVECPEIARMMHRLWAGEADLASNIFFFMQFMGAALLGRATKFQRALILLGPARSGKSSLLKLFDMCFPAEAISGVPIQQMETAFGPASMIDKRLNVVYDLPTDMIKDTGNFKAIVCGESLNLEKKFVQGARGIINAAHVFVCNELPPVRRGDSGFWRRFIALRCQNVIAEEDVNANIADKFRAEIPKFIALALECAFALREVYCIPATSRDIIDEWTIEASPIAMFLMQNYRPLDEKERTAGSSAFAGVSTKAIEEFYAETMRKSGHKGVYSTTWPRQLGEAVKALKWPGLSDKKVQTPSGRNFVYPFVRL